MTVSENLWHYLFSHHWSNRLYQTWEDLRDAAVNAWRRVCLVVDLVKSLCADTACARIKDDPYKSFGWPVD